MILKDICTIISNYMDLPTGQVWLRNEKYPLPFEKTFTISVGFQSLKSMGTSARSSFVTTDGTTVQSEILGTNMFGQVIVEIMGRSFDVIERKEEIVQAFLSMDAQNLMHKNSFVVGHTPLSIVDASGLDGPAIPYRFQYTFAVQFVVSKTKIKDNYYENFSQPEVTYDAT